ncbi:hypothetical protein E1263_34365 [Kribbella antibiotica]|uniref:SMP-30/Gluconolactonase/LRE-like region domain-containing protein n=1 Tax=Kribbella antibiotica TaxID=190195 RepID=A0A4R4YT46_9ACTN|nr:hypothetical protein [Kribbella antibiotica]TDD47584.1 hypothetical protein E1263_34365 [Kribbella antibiotica]
MFKPIAVVTLAAALLGLQPAAATTSPYDDVRVAAHFDLASGQQPENIALAPSGVAYVTFAVARQVARVAPDGSTRILATLPAPAAGSKTPVLGFPLTSGIVRDGGTLYFLYATGTADLTGVWRLRPGGRPERIAALPATGVPNGLALDERTGNLYIADSVLGTIWRVSKSGGRAQAWSTAPELASTGFLGANGLKLRGGAVWVTNLDRGTILRLPIDHRGNAGKPQTRATGLAGIDDFAFTGHGNQLLATLNGSSTVVLVQGDGTSKPILTPANGLQNPTSLAVRGTTAYILSAAYLTQKDPNLILARLPR